MKVHLLFEQSGTFKNEFKKLGYEAYDYDIGNKYDETDYVIDLFQEIDNYYLEKETIFDNISKDDLTLAFFPCIYFSIQNNLIWKRQFRAFKQWEEQKIDDYILNRKKDRLTFFTYFWKMVHIFKVKGLKLVVENPHRGNYLLTTEFDKPSLVINDRREYGDNHIKPTMFYFFNFEPKYNIVFMEISKKEVLKHNDIGGHKRSLLHPEFAHNFIIKHLID